MLSKSMAFFLCAFSLSFLVCFFTLFSGVLYHIKLAINIQMECNHSTWKWRMARALLMACF